MYNVNLYCKVDLSVVQRDELAKTRSILTDLADDIEKVDHNNYMVDQFRDTAVMLNTILLGEAF